VRSTGVPVVGITIYRCGKLPYSQAAADRASGKEPSDYAVGQNAGNRELIDKDGHLLAPVPMNGA
jgi:hypothetical protein